MILCMRTCDLNGQIEFKYIWSFSPDMDENYYLRSALAISVDKGFNIGQLFLCPYSTWDENPRYISVKDRIIERLENRE